MSKIKSVVRLFSFKSLLSFAWLKFEYQVGKSLFRLVSKQSRLQQMFFNRLGNSGIVPDKKERIIFFDYPVNGTKTKIFLRENTSDLPVFFQIILEEEYKVVIELLQGNSKEKLRIIDAGANIGMTSMVLKRFFPHSDIVCVEPGKANEQQLKEHINRNELNGIEIVPKGIWNKDCFLKPVKFRDGKDWSFAVKEVEPGETGEIEGTTLLSIAQHYKWEVIDFLKMDIEGSEKVLFEDEQHITKVLSMTRIIALEPHEEHISKEKIVDVLHKNDYLCFSSGELIIGMNKKQLIANGT